MSPACIHLCRNLLIQMPASQTLACTSLLRGTSSCRDSKTNAHLAVEHQLWSLSEFCDLQHNQGRHGDATGAAGITALREDRVQRAFCNKHKHLQTRMFTTQGSNVSPADRRAQESHSCRPSKPLMETQTGHKLGRLQNMIRCKARHVMIQEQTNTTMPHQRIQQ